MPLSVTGRFLAIEGALARATAEDQLRATATKPALEVTHVVIALTRAQQDSMLRRSATYVYQIWRQ